MANDATATGDDRETRIRFLQITEETGALLREFWTVIEPALPAILEGFYGHVTREPALARMIGGDIPRLKQAQGTPGRAFSAAASTRPISRACAGSAWSTTGSGSSRAGTSAATASC